MKFLFNRIVFLLSICYFVCFYSCTPPQTQPAPKISAKLVASEGEKKVITSGYGKNPDEALTQALRNAVEEAVGTYMTSTTRIENDELIEDKILSLSRGFIKDFKKLSEMKVDGEIKVTVAAIVTGTQILETLKASGVKVKVAGKKMFQQFANFERQMEDEFNVIYELLKDMPAEGPFDYTVEVLGQPVRYGAYYSIRIKIIGKINDNFRNQYTNIRNILQETSFENKIINTKVFLDEDVQGLGFEFNKNYNKEMTIDEYKNYLSLYGSDIFSRSPSPFFSGEYYDFFGKPYSPYVIALWLDSHSKKDYSGKYHFYKYLNWGSHKIISRFIQNYFFDIRFSMILKSDEKYNIDFDLVFLRSYHPHGNFSQPAYRITNNNDKEVLVLNAETHQGYTNKHIAIKYVFRYFKLVWPTFDKWGKNNQAIWNDGLSIPTAWVKKFRKENNFIDNPVYQILIFPSPNTYTKKMGRAWENISFQNELTLLLSEDVFANLESIEIEPLPVRKDF